MLDFINQSIEVLSRSPGDLVYYLIILFAIEAMLGLAVVRARPEQVGDQAGDDNDEYHHHREYFETFAQLGKILTNMEFTDTLGGLPQDWL